MAGNNSDMINEADYSYDGNLPNSKEAAIVMISDSVEAASRTVKKPTSTKYEKLINSIIMASLSAAAINSPAATVYLTKTTVISMDELNSKVKGYQDAFSASGQDPTKVNVLDVLNTMINDELFRQGAARDKVVITDSMIDQAYNQMMNQYKSMLPVISSLLDNVVVVGELKGKSIL